MRFKYGSSVIFWRMLLALVLVSLGSLSALAQCNVQQIAKLLADDGEAGDFFSFSVSISGTNAIVGAFFSDGGHIESGSVYLFDTTTGQQITKLVPDDGAAFDHFGFSVAISGTTAIAGATGDDDNGNASGSAYVFDTTTGEQIAKLLPNDGAAGDRFGDSVAISGTTAIIGVYDDDDNGHQSGSAYLFDTTTGQQITKLLPNDGAEHDWFGSSVAIDGTKVIIGAPGWGGQPGSGEAAYLFDVLTGMQIAKLVPNDGAAGDRFGRSVSISGTAAIVGAPGDDDNGDNSGSAYLFDVTTAQQIMKLLPDDGMVWDSFGAAVAIDGTSAIIGAPGGNSHGGTGASAFLFDVVTGMQIGKLLPDGGLNGDEFGTRIAISGAIAVVGDYLADDNGDNSGSAYLFDVRYCSDVVIPDLFLVTRGTYVAGGVVELGESDNLDLSIRRSTADTQSRTEFELKGVSPVAGPSTLEVTLEGSVFARSQVDQTIELFDYVAGAWVQVDTRTATHFSDSTATVAATGDLFRFVEAGTMCVQARIRYQSTNLRQRFSSNTDQFIWTIGQ